MYGKQKTDSMRKSKDTGADFKNKPEAAISFLAAKIAVCPMIAQGGPTGWLAGKKSSSLRSGIFFRQALPQSPSNGQHIQQEIKMPTHVGGCLT